MPYEAIDPRTNIHMALRLGFENPAGGDLILEKVGSEASGLLTPLAEHGQLSPPWEITRFVFGKEERAVTSEPLPIRNEGWPEAWLDSSSA